MPLIGGRDWVDREEIALQLVDERIAVSRFILTGFDITCCQVAATIRTQYMDRSSIEFTLLDGVEEALREQKMRFTRYNRRSVDRQVKYQDRGFAYIDPTMTAEQLARLIP
jgi:hypothetical protein